MRVMMTTKSLMTPDRLHSLRPSDIAELKKACATARGSYAVLLVFSRYLLALKAPRAVELDDVVRVALQLNMAGLWNKVRPEYYVRYFHSHIDPEVLGTLCYALEINLKTAMADIRSIPGDNPKEMEKVIRDLKLALERPAVFVDNPLKAARPIKPAEEFGISPQEYVAKPKISAAVSTHYLTNTERSGVNVRSVRARAGSTITISYLVDAKRLFVQSVSSDTAISRSRQSIMKHLRTGEETVIEPDATATEQRRNPTRYLIVGKDQRTLRKCAENIRKLGVGNSPRINSADIGDTVVFRTSLVDNPLSGRAKRTVLGTVKFYNKKNGFLFIQPDSSQTMLAVDTAGDETLAPKLKQGARITVRVPKSD
jgi:cold shock CspA family protein